MSIYVAESSEERQSNETISGDDFVIRNSGNCATPGFDG